MALGAKIAVGTIAAGLVAGGIYLFVLSPRAERAKVHQEIDEWGKDFRDLEVCILGETPLSSDATEAVTLRELSLPVGENYLKECLQLTKDLERPAGYGSGSMEVETSWFKLKDPIGRLASRMALRTAEDHWYRDPEVQRGAIARGIDELGTAYDTLRKAAGMKPAPRHGSKIPRLPEPPAGVAVEIPGAGTFSPPVAELQAGVMAVEGAGQILLIRGPDRVERFPLEQGIVRAAGGAPWGIWLEGTAKKLTIRTGALDDIGRPAGQGTVIHEVPLRMSEDWGAMAALIPRAAVGDGAVRMATFEAHLRADGEWGEWRNTAFVAWSRDGGATWSKSPFEHGGSAVFVSQVPARVDLWWEDPQLRWLSAPAGMAAAPVAQTSTGRVPMQLCRAQGSMWWIRGATVSLETGGKLQDLPLDIGKKLRDGILACDDTRAAHVTYAGESLVRSARFEVCSAEGCGVGTPIPAWENATVMAAFGPKHGFSAAVLAEGYLVLWRAPDGGGAGLKPRPLYHMPDRLLHAIAEWDGVLYALISGAGGARLIPLPL